MVTTLATTSPIVFETQIKSLERLHRGKVRDVYAIDADSLLIITTDRLSAFDVVLPDPIPGKGQVLNRISNFWFARTGHIVPNHLTGDDPESVVAADEITQVRNRSMLVKRLTPLPVEAVVRGYLAGSGWKEYQQSRSVRRAAARRFAQCLAFARAHLHPGGQSCRWRAR